MVASGIWYGWVRWELTYYRIMTCHAHMGLLLRAVKAYVEDHDGRFPPGEKWSDELMIYVRDRDAFPCPAAINGACSYAYNGALSGLSYREIGKPEMTVVFFESDAGWNVSGGPELLPETPRHGTGATSAALQTGARMWSCVEGPRWAQHGPRIGIKQHCNGVQSPDVWERRTSEYTWGAPFLVLSNVNYALLSRGRGVAV